MNKPWTMAQVKRAQQLRQGGLSLRQVALALGKSASHAGRLLRARGCPSPPADELRERQGEAQAQRNRDFCARLGWPEVVVPGQARVLDALHRLGPLDHAALALAAGWTLRVGPRGGLRSWTLERHLLALTRPFVIEARELKLAERSRRLVEVRPGASGRTRRYALSAWLLARRETS